MISIKSLLFAPFNRLYRLLDTFIRLVVTFNILPKDISDLPDDIIRKFNYDVSVGEYKKARLLWDSSAPKFISNPQIFGKATVALFDLFLRTHRFSETIETLKNFINEGVVPSAVLDDMKIASSSESNPEYKEILLVIRTQYGICQLMGTCDFQAAGVAFTAAMDYLEGSRDNWSNGVEDPEFISTYKVLILRYAAKICLLGYIFKYPSANLCIENTKSRLAPLFETFLSKLRAQGRIEEAYSLLTEYEALDPFDATHNRRELLADAYDNDRVPPHIIGNMYFNLAEAALKAHDRHTARLYAALALVYFNACDNLLGKWRVTHLQLRLSENFHQGEAVGLNRFDLHVIVRLCDLHESRGNTTDLLSLLMDRANMEVASANFVSYLDTSDNICNIFHHTGANLLRLNTRIGQTALFFRRTGNTAKALECIDAFMEEVSRVRVPYLHSMAASVASGVYESMRRWNTALRFAEISLQHATGCDTKLESIARYAILRTRKEMVSAQLKMLPNARLTEEYHGLMDTLDEDIEEDIKKGLYQEAVDKLLYLHSMHIEDLTTPARVKVERMRRAMDRIFPISLHLGSRPAQALLAQVLQRRGLQFLVARSKENLERALAVTWKAREIYARLHIYYQIAVMDHQIGLILLEKYALMHSDAESLLKASESFLRACSVFEALGQTSEYINSSASCLRALFLIILQWSKFKIDLGLIETTLNRTAKWIDYYRAELSSLGGLQAVLAKQSISQDKSLRDTGEMGIQYYLAAERMDLVWQWVQKQKARSISDMMGLGNIEHDPFKLEDDNVTPEAGKLLAEYSNLLAQIHDAPLSNRMHLRVRFAGVVDKMLQYDELKEITHLRLGSSIDLAELNQMIPPDRLPAGKNVVLIDWFSIGVVIYVLISRPGQPVMIHNLRKPVSFVNDWIQDNFTEADDVQVTLEYDWSAPSTPFRDLDFLIQPIAEWSAPGDLIVLSPGYPLHSIPLHALNIVCESGNEILIRRNPVVYTPSLTILKHCISRASKKRTFGAENIRCAGIYDFKYPFQAVERQLIQQNLETMGEKLGTKPLWGEDCTKEALRSHLDGASFFHFHGHCHFDKENVLNHALVTAGVYDKLPGFKANSLGSIKLLEEDIENSKRRVQFLSAKPWIDLEPDSNIRTSETGLSIAEVFEVTLPGPVISIVACESASQKIGPGEEPLGLPTAFLCAGAASYIGTMWEMPCEQGRVFSTEFYKSLVGKRGEKTVDLALVLREAVLGIMKNPASSEYMYWAPLVLYGSWFCQGEVFWACDR
ncbi:hypothetical protein ABW20_dc0106456 [Dactylellina cionopaga]|nr:hypothetical protein ABW20_dc0106456 [Dactylellina cionopaga]